MVLRAQAPAHRSLSTAATVVTVVNIILTMIPAGFKALRSLLLMFQATNPLGLTEVTRSLI